MSKRTSRPRKLTLGKETIASMTVRSDVKAGLPATTRGRWPSCNVVSAIVIPFC